MAHLEAQEVINRSGSFPVRFTSPAAPLTPVTHLAALQAFWRTFDTSFSEFQSSLASFAMGGFFMVGHASQEDLRMLQPLLGQMPAASWGLLFLAFGAMQFIARMFMPRARRRLASFLSFLFWLYVGVLAAIQTPTPLVTLLPILLAATNWLSYYRLATWHHDLD